jgi:hypothetical protein
MARRLASVLGAALLAGAAAAQVEAPPPPPPAPHAEPPPIEPVLELSTSLRALFVSEMQQVDRGFQRVALALPRGDWAAVEEGARLILRASILEKPLSDEQREELLRALPEDFLALDSRFHRSAEKLASAARARDADLVALHFSRLAEGCVTCHDTYATGRFPGFAPRDLLGEEH